MKIKVVIFDMDGMVVDHDRPSDRLPRDFGIPKERTLPFFTGKFQECLVGRADLKQELKKVVPVWGWEGSVDDLLAYWFKPEHSRINEKFEPVIRSLKDLGAKVCLATNNEKYRVTNLVQDRGLGRWFDWVFASSEIGAKKPEAEFFKKIKEETGVSFKSMLLWDDDIHDIEAVKELGLVAEQYRGFEEFRSKLQEYFPKLA